MGGWVACGYNAAGDDCAVWCEGHAWRSYQPMFLQPRVGIAGGVRLNRCTRHKRPTERVLTTIYRWSSRRVLSWPTDLRTAGLGASRRAGLIAPRCKYIHSSVDCPSDREVPDIRPLPRRRPDVLPLFFAQFYLTAKCDSKKTE